MVDAQLNPVCHCDNAGLELNARVTVAEGAARQTCFHLACGYTNIPYWSCGRWSAVVAAVLGGVMHMFQPFGRAPGTAFGHLAAGWQSTIASAAL